MDAQCLCFLPTLQVFDAGEDPRVESRMLMFGLKSAADVAVGSGALNASQRHRLTAAELTVGVYPVSCKIMGGYWEWSVAVKGQMALPLPLKGSHS